MEPSKIVPEYASMKRRLFQASQEGDFEMVKSLITDGVDVNDVLSLGFTALTVASTFGHKSLVQTLIDCGANVNTATTEGSLH